MYSGCCDPRHLTSSHRRDIGGVAHCTFSSTVSFLNRESPKPEEIKTKLQRSLLRLRHLVPSIALKTSRLPSNEYQFKYIVPDSLDDALRWCDEVLFVNEEGESLEENHRRISDTVWWCAEDEPSRHTWEVYAYPDTERPGNWQIR